MSLKSTAILAIFLACIVFVQSKDCSKACTLEYNPICASNGKEFQIFGNPCQFEVANCEEDSVWTKADSMADCQADTTDIAAELNCEKPCTFELNPVCGSNGESHKIFDNLCELENAHCMDNKVWFQTLMMDCQTPVNTKSDCTKPCTREYMPVCGFNGENHEIFNNFCELNNAHCVDGKAWFQSPITECFIPINVNDDCYQACTLEYDPVCGFNGEKYQIFGNPCTLKNAHCEDGKTWVQTLITDCKIPVALKAGCTKPCTRELDPVCGFNGEENKLFSNPCEFKNAHCQDGKSWVQTLITDCKIPVALKAGCTKPCTRELDPVCGFNGEENKLFSNPCEFNNAHCQDGKTWTKMAFTDCVVPAKLESNCEVPCTREYNPICGFNGEHYEVFSNACELKNAHCKDANTWSAVLMAKCLARASFDTKCEKPCTRELWPVCGFNGERHQMFSNKCIMENAHCNDGKQWSQTRFEDCKENEVSVADIQKSCEVPCTREYNPVCGYSGKTHKVFSNKCVMANEHCKDGQTWSETLMSECLVRDNTNDCPKMCPAVYAPTCGFDGTTYHKFSNLCQMEVSNCDKHTNFHVVDLKECVHTIEKEEDCPTICPMIYAPTCGFDGLNYKLFSSPCDMKASNCNQHTNYHLNRLSDCQA